MNRLFVHGFGAVSPAGWGLPAFREVLEGSRSLSPVEVSRPDGMRLRTFRVPAPATRPAWLMHPRLRRSSPISHYTVAAALEALGAADRVVEAPGLGIVLCVMGGSVQYSRRFFAEALADPSTASPMLFPETVFNAPASHLGALLATGARNDTCVADQSGFLAGLVTAADWLDRGEVDACLVIAAEEADWTTAAAARVFSRRSVLSEGAAAVLLRREPGPVELTAVTSPKPHAHGRHALAALDSIRKELCVSHGSPCFTHGCGNAGIANEVAMENLLGDGLSAAGGWTCIAAIDALIRGRARTVSACVAGANLQSLGASFSRSAG